MEAIKLNLKEATVNQKERDLKKKMDGSVTSRNQQITHQKKDIKFNKN